jgi:hypothetical protein
MVGESAINAIVDAASVKIGFEVRVYWLGMALVNPYAQLFHLLRGERVYRALNFLYWVHGAPSIILAEETRQGTTVIVVVVAAM